MEKLLVICGLTATGKTKLALHLSKLFNGEVVSADSRQVYTGMDIGTGKEIPKTFKFKDFKVGYYTDGKIRIWGYDLVDPKENFSVAQYILIAQKIIEDIWMREKLPILVGGTGLYIKGIVDGIPTAKIPQNLELREHLKNKTVTELQDSLGTLDPFRLASMNVSDINNPRRLIRAIEISECNNRGSAAGTSMNRFIDTDKEVLTIGLTCPKEVLNKRINKRIQVRLKQGIEEEIRQLLSSGVAWHMQSMQSLGYKEWQEFLLNSKTEEEIVEKWTSNEKNYAKHQLVWFKKDKRINWFDISKENWLPNIEKLVKKWHNN